MYPTITHNTNHVGIGLGRLILQYREKPRLSVVLTAFLNEVQAVEDALWAVLTQRLTDANPVGAQIDVLGRIVNQGREGLSDAAYLSLIRARIKANRSDSTISTLISILQLILGTSTTITVREYAKAVELEVDNLSGINAYQIWREFLQVAKEAGTSIRLIFSGVASTNTLKLSDASPGATFVTTVSQRVDDTNVPGGGGLLAGVL